MNENVQQFPADRETPIDRRSGNGNGGIENRLRLLEIQVARVETRLDTMATKEDLQKMENTLIKWMVGMMATSTVALIVAVVRTFFS